jgi:hypothetical protein
MSDTWETARSAFTLCGETGKQAIKGLCPDHGGDACLRVYAAGYSDGEMLVIREKLSRYEAALERAEQEKFTVWRCRACGNNRHSPEEAHGCYTSGDADPIEVVPLALLSTDQETSGPPGPRSTHAESVKLDAGPRLDSASDSDQSPADRRCPDCEGMKEVVAEERHDPEAGLVRKWMPCPTCSGTGRLTDQEQTGG